MEMFDQCPICKQPTDIEVGFYYGTGYLSYFICIAIVIASFLIWYLTIGFSFNDKRFLYWIIFLASYLPYFNRGLCVFQGCFGYRFL